MIKKILFVVVLALQAAAMVNVASGSLPIPQCDPCGN